jgi:ATP-dependent protease HslVU (ClpYQ) peptidase subunit
VTCIVGIKSQGRVWIGGDSAAMSGLELTVRADEKVFINGPFVMGFSASYRMGQLLRYSFSPPQHPEECSTEKFMVTTFVDAVRDCLKQSGWATKEHGREDSGGAFMVGYRGELFSVYGDFQVERVAIDFNALGCGAQVALGSLDALTRRTTLSPEEVLEDALRTAQRWSGGVREPFIILPRAES